MMFSEQGRRKVYNKIIICFLFVLSFFVYLLLTRNKSEIGANESLYWTIIISLIPFSLICCFAAAKDVYLFEPIFLSLVLYFGIFYLQPLLDIRDGSIVFADGGIKATVLFSIGLLVYTFGYYINYGRSTRLVRIPGFVLNISDSAGIKISFYAVCIWIVSFFACMIYFLGSGYSLSYVLSIGLTGEANIKETSGLMIFFTLKSCMTASWLYIMLFGKSKFIKISTFIISALLLMSLGGRTSLFEYMLAPVFYHYAKNGKRPSARVMTCFFAVGFVLAVIIQQIRYGVRLGTGFIMPEFTVDTLLSPFKHELGIYHSFYAVVKTIPSKHSYLYGSGIFVYTLIMLIPRGIWPGKPNPPIYEVIGTSMGQLYVDGGAVYPNIGEYYVEFGIIGIVLFMFIFGVFLRRINALRQYGGERSHAMVLYSALAPLVIQLVSRGYTPSNFTQLLLTAFPVFLIYWRTKRSVKYEQNS